MAKHPVILPSKRFSSKTEAKSFFKDMLSRYLNGETIQNLDDQLLFEVLQRHPEIDEKCGGQIKRFFKAKAIGYPTDCFHFERLDGSTTDFSVPYCIDSNKRTAMLNFYNACRFSVSEKINAQKVEIFKSGPVHCCKTSELLTIDNCDYRHTQPPFRQIVSEFIRNNQIEVTNGLIVDNDDMQYATAFSDPKMGELFNEYLDSTHKCNRH